MHNTIKPYSLLKPAKAGEYGPRDDYIIAGDYEWWNAASIVAGISGPVIVDTETTGLDVLAPEFRCVGIGIAGKGLEGGMYFSLKNGENPVPLLKALLKRQLIAVNVIYDAKVLEVMCQQYGLASTLSAEWPWHIDIISLYHHLSAGEWLGQSKGLKAMQVDILAWEEQGDVELVEWLNENGLGKGDMWQAPDSILGYYCCLDVQSTYQLYEHLKPQYDQFPDAWDYITEAEVKYQYRAIAEMFFRGILIDEVQMKERKKELESNIANFRSQFLNNELVKPWIEQITNTHIQALAEKEPPRLTKTGKVTARWTKWKEKVTSFGVDNWLNLNSKAQLRDLFFNFLFTTDPVEPVLNYYTKEQKEFKGGKLMWQVNIHLPDSTILHEWAAKTNDIPVTKELLPKLGPVGEMLYQYNYDVKMLGFVNGTLDKLRDGILHAELRPLATVTGRAGGTGGLSMQILPKDKGYLDCFKARPEHSLISQDFTALEPKVLTVDSNCPTYRQLYGPEAKPNDIYIFLMSKISVFKHITNKYGYDPNNPTKEAIAAIKENHKKERSICKVLHLSSAYGAGIPKIHKTLLSQGVDISFEETRNIYKEYWTIFKRVKEYESELVEERNQNGGYIVNGLGIPTTVPKHKVKDAANQRTQSGGHQILVRHLANVMKLRDNRQLPFWIYIADIHDDINFEALDKVLPNVIQLLEDAEKLTNEQLGCDIYFDAEPEAAKVYTAFKL
jgi:DNA polymerase I-like protein with 3'-5' exonuclease and polymerase domains